MERLMRMKILAHTMEYRGEAVVAEEHQKKGYGRQLLWFAVSYLQKKNCSPILLHVADWNQEAVELYRKNGFVITKTEYV